MRRFTIGLAFLLLLIFQVGAGATNTWIDQTSPASQGLNDVCFIDTSTGIAVGDNRNIIKTTDYGTTWTSKSPGFESQSHFHGIQFPTASVGYIAGATTSALFYKTTDTGETWSDLSSHVGTLASQLYDLQFFDANNGWVVGYHDTEAALLKTTDGGISWERKAIGASGNRTYFGLHFIDTNTGWVVGSLGLIYKTTDGGTNWTQQGTTITNQNLRDVFFIDSNNGWTVGEGSVIMKTTNGGTTWSLIDCGISNAYFTKVYFINATTSWVVGWSGLVLKSTDGGETWAPDTNITTSDTEYLNGINFVDPNNATIVGKGSDIIFNYGAVPDFSLSPSTRAQGWSGTITCTASAYFRPDVAVTISKTGGSGFDYTYSYNSSMEITIPTTLAADATTGDWTVTLTDGDGRSAAQTFTVNDAPTISDISPANRAQGWSGDMTVTGTNFRAGATASVAKSGGSGFAYSYTRDSATQFTIPATLAADATTGDWTITVTNTDTSATSAAFAVNASLAIDSVTPDNKYLGWTGEITLEGSGFQSSVAVTMTKTGGTGLSYSYNRDSATKITLTATIAATASVGAWVITATNPDSSANTATFTVNNLPKIISLSPASLTQGATARDIVITGDYFQDGLTTSSLSFAGGGITINSLTRNSTTSVTANLTIASSATTGDRAITLTNPDGGITTASDLFSISAASTPTQPNPTISSVSPNTGDQGTSSLNLTVRGENFLATPTVSLGSGITVNSVTFNDATSLTANISIAASAALGSRTITVTNSSPAGSLGSMSDAFFVTASGALPVTIESVSPNLIYVTSEGAAASLAFRPLSTSLNPFAEASQILTIYGHNFHANPSASFSPSLPIQSINRRDSSHILVYFTPSVGTYDITVSNSDDGSSGTGSNLLTVRAASTNAVTMKSVFAYPNPWNPLSGNLTLQFFFDRACQIKIVIAGIDLIVRGEIVQNCVAGKNNITWDGNPNGSFSHLPQGIYVMTIYVIENGSARKLGTYKLGVAYFK